MLYALTLVTPDAAALPLAEEPALQALTAAGARVKETRSLGAGAIDYLVEGEHLAAVRPAMEIALADLPVDFAFQLWAGRKKRLLIADMDSTIIGCECLDELADFAGVKNEVSAITEQAMRGEIDFEGALRERVAMLAGLELSALERCYQGRVRLNAGARTVVQTMTAHGARCILVSGGFRFFTQRVAKAAGFALDRANSLIDDGAKLTGTVGEPILGREAKLEALLEETAALGIKPFEALAVGDGANDLMMIRAAGLGVAYRAKPVVASEADARIDHADLTALLYFQGYSSAEFMGAESQHG
jgi:phosphoserine phosphatase